MRIAQVAPLVERIPPKMYGGTERVIYALTEELVARGHEVTLFASADSETSARLRSVYPRSLREARLKNIYELNVWTLLNIGLAYSIQDEFDVIHDHLMPLSLPTANLSRTPVVGTVHGPFGTDDRRLYQALREPHIVTISRSQLPPLLPINHAGTVYNGLIMDDYPFGDSPEDYLLFVGRISMEKGVHLAVEAAQHLDKRLIIAAKLDKVDVPYFREYVEPMLSSRIEWIGEVDEGKRNELMSRALCFLHPVTWREPFGLTLIEAQACGCPVIAINKGSIPEIVDHGVTGYVVDDLDSMVEAIENIDKINRAACRERALSKFSAKCMAEGYEEVYRKVIGARSVGSNFVNTIFTK